MLQPDFQQQLRTAFQDLKRQAELRHIVQQAALRTSTGPRCGCRLCTGGGVHPPPPLDTTPPLRIGRDAA